MKRKYFKSIFAILLVVLVGCGRNTQPESKVRKVAVATLMTHPALDSIIANMKTELARRGFKDGETVQYIIKNANGDPNLAVTIIRELQRENPDVLVPITTPIAQVAVKEARSPIVFSA